MKIIDNFLDKDEFNNLNNIIMGDNFPWFYNDFITTSADPSDRQYFTHIVYREPGTTSEWFSLFKKVLVKIKCNSIMRIKANMHLRESKERINISHFDYPFKHKGCLLYINDNNGATYIGKEKIIPKANRALFFDPSQLHSSSPCTDKKRRVNINFNYF